MNGPEQGMNFAQPQGMSVMQGNVQPAYNPFSSQGFPAVQQPEPGPGFPPPGPVSPQPYPQLPGGGFSQSQPYPQMPPNGGFPVQGPMVPQQAFPPQQSFPPQQDFPPARPNAGFYPSNMGNGDIALALDAASIDMSSADTGNLAKHKPIRLHGLNSSRTDDIPVIPDTPRPEQETNAEEFLSFDDPILRDTLNHYRQRGKQAQDGKPPDDAKWI